jgi:hypothetical protein
MRRPLQPSNASKPPSHQPVVIPHLVSAHDLRHTFTGSPFQSVPWKNPRTLRPLSPVHTSTARLPYTSSSTSLVVRRPIPLPTCVHRSDARHPSRTCVPPTAPRFPHPFPQRRQDPMKTTYGKNHFWVFQPRSKHQALQHVPCLSEI